MSDKRSNNGHHPSSIANLRSFGSVGSNPQHAHDDEVFWEESERYHITLELNSRGIESQTVGCGGGRRTLPIKASS